MAAGLFSVLLCTPVPAVADHLVPQTILRISAAEQGTGIYHQAKRLASIFAEQNTLNRSSPSHNHYLGVAMSSPGSIGNIKDLTDGRAEFAIVSGTLANDAFMNPDQADLDQAIQRLRLVATLQPYVLQILVRNDRDNPTMIDELKNATVSIGLPDAKTDRVIRDLMMSQDIALGEMTVHHYPLSLALRLLRDSQIDAIFLLDSIERSAEHSIIAPLVMEGHLSLVSLNSDKLQAYLDVSNDTGLTLTTISPYSNTPASYVSVRTDAYLLAQDTVSPTNVLPIIETLKAENDRLASTVNNESGSESGSVQYRLKNIQSVIPMHDALNMVGNSLSDEGVITAPALDPVADGNLDDL